MLLSYPLYPLGIRQMGYIKMNLVEAQPGSASGQRNEYEYFTIIETSYTTSATALSFSALDP